MSESASHNGAPQKRARARKSASKKKAPAEKAAAEQVASERPAPQTVAPRSPESASAVPPAAAAPGVRETRRPVTEQVEVVITALDRRTMVATAAYYRAERRQFASGHELEDWLAAEADVEALVRKQVGVSRRNAPST